MVKLREMMLVLRPRAHARRAAIRITPAAEASRR
jgi:hypothetical protein